MRHLGAGLVDWLATHGERIVYRAAGLPITLGTLFAMGAAKPEFVVRKAYAHHYVRPEGIGDWLDLFVALSLLPLALAISAAWFTLRNGPTIARRYGRPVVAQLADQLRLFFADGILPPWYYIFSLHDRDCRRHAAGFLNRCETKCGAYPVLIARHAASSPLGDKQAFAAHCQAHGLPVIPILAVARDGRIEAGERLCEADLFVKPVRARGGKGAERWDYLGNGRYSGGNGLVLDRDAFLDRLRHLSLTKPRLVQPRLRNHPAIADLSNGALATVRALTCLDEQGRPELIAAVFRMAIGGNRTVDNIHAGGIAAGIDLETGAMSQASDLGMSARLGWLDRHPDTGAPISGRIFPRWPELRVLAEQAHWAFLDRVFVGWDIALAEAGFRLVEGNSGPDVDLMQRPIRRGLMEGRFGALLAYHLQAVP